MMGIPHAQQGEPLTDGEIDTLQCAAYGMSGEQTRRELGVAKVTVFRRHMSAKVKLGALTMTQAVVIAHAAGLVSAPEPSGTVRPLSARQREVLGLLGAGWTGPAIADRLGVQVETIDDHMIAIRAALDAKGVGRPGLVMLAKAHDLLTWEDTHPGNPPR